MYHSMGLPATRLFHDDDNPLPQSFTENLVFVEPTSTLKPFSYGEKPTYHVHRVGWPFSHARVLTSTPTQGQTCRDGVIIDCARRREGEEAMDEDSWWLDLYVMLSRATRLEDPIVVRAPPAQFLLRGPPATLKSQLEKLV